MRVLTDSPVLLRRREFRGPGVVEEQERTEHRSQVRVGEERSNREPVAYPVPIDAAHAAQLLEGKFLFLWLHGSCPRLRERDASGLGRSSSASTTTCSH